MKNQFLLLVFIFGLSVTIKAQQRALTADGTVVILYNNGTWKYADGKKITTPGKVKKTIPKFIPKPIPKPIPMGTIILKKGESEEEVFINGPSPKLSRYFKTRNIIRAKFQLISNGNSAILKTNWRVVTGEAFSYFGFINRKCSITLELANGNVVDLKYVSEYSPNEYPKYGFSTYVAELPISKEELIQLGQSIVVKATMNWNRRSEIYKVENPAYFIKAIPQICLGSKK